MRVTYESMREVMRVLKEFTLILMPPSTTL